MSKRTRPFLFLGCSLWVGGSAFGGVFSANERGTSAATFLGLGAGARAVAMGEAYSAAADDPTALYWNPAALTQAPALSATLMHAPYVDNSYYDYLGISHRVGERSAVGAGLQYFASGKLDQTDVTGTSIGTLHPNDLAASLGYARLFGSVSAGAAVKYIRSEIQTSAQTAAVDLGLLAPVSERLRLSAAVANLGGKMKFDNESFDLPMMIRAGGALKLTESWLTALDVVLPRANDPSVAVGTDIRFPWGGGAVEAPALRFGYNTRSISELGPASGFAAGIGFRIHAVGIDYAVVPFSGFGPTHRISVTMLKFGGDNSPISRFFGERGSSYYGQKGGL